VPASYSGGRDQEIMVQSQKNSSRDPILKKPSLKRAGKIAEGVGPEFKPQYSKEKKRRKKNEG
jgi:hypothetical protein